MTFAEYQEQAGRTTASLDFGDKLINGVMGLAGETGEVADLVKKAMFQGHSLDIDKIAEELGDVLWYINLISSAIDEMGHRGFTLDEIAQINITKLQKRYPNGFDTERSQNR